MLRLDFIRNLLGMGAVSAFNLPALLPKETLPYHALECEVAGLQYYAGPELFETMEIGEGLDLVREPDNQFDRSAIALYYQGHKIGFIPRRYNRVISNMLDSGFNGFTAVIDHLEEDDYSGFQVIGIKVVAKATVG